MSQTPSNEPRFLARRAANRFRTAAGQHRRRSTRTFSRSWSGLMLQRRPSLTTAAILPGLARIGRPALWGQVSRRMTDQVTQVKPKYAGQSLGGPAGSTDLPLVTSAFSLPSPEDEPNFAVETIAPPTEPPVSMAQLREILAQRGQVEPPTPAEPAASRLSRRPAQPRPPQPTASRLQAKRQRFSRIEELPAHPAERSAPPPASDEPQPIFRRPVESPPSPIPAASPPDEPTVSHMPSPAEPEEEMTLPPLPAPTEPEPRQKRQPTIPSSRWETGALPIEPPARPTQLAASSPEPQLRAGHPATSTPKPDIESPVESPSQSLPPAQSAAPDMITPDTTAPIVQTSALEKSLPPVRPNQPPEEDKQPVAAQPLPPSPAAAQSEPVSIQNAPVLPSKQAQKNLPPMEQTTPQLPTKTSPDRPPATPRRADGPEAVPPMSGDLLAEASPAQELPTSEATPMQVDGPDQASSQTPLEPNLPRPGEVKALALAPAPILTAAKYTADPLLSRPQQVAQRVATKRSQWGQTTFKPRQLPAPAAKLSHAASGGGTSLINVWAGNEPPLPVKSVVQAAAENSQPLFSAATTATQSAGDERIPAVSPAAGAAPRSSGPVNLPLPVIHRPNAPGPIVVQRQTVPASQTTPALTLDLGVVARQPAGETEPSVPAAASPPNPGSTGSSPTGVSGVNLDDLASQIYPLLKRRLALELERRPRW